MCGSRGCRGQVVKPVLDANAILKRGRIEKLMAFIRERMKENNSNHKFIKKEHRKCQDF